MGKNLLKTIIQEKIIVEKKYSTEHIFVKHSPFFTLTDNLFKYLYSKINQLTYNHILGLTL
jgi:hypothetical protein